jgi:hypothetical protein
MIDPITRADLLLAGYAAIEARLAEIEKKIKQVEAWNS